MTARARAGRNDYGVQQCVALFVVAPAAEPSGSAAVNGFQLPVSGSRRRCRRRRRWLPVPGDVAEQHG